MATSVFLKLGSKRSKKLNYDKVYTSILDLDFGNRKITKEMGLAAHFYLSCSALVVLNRSKILPKTKAPIP